MNHKEKRQMEKKLGLLDYRKKLNRTQRFELIRQNIIAGNKKEAELKGEDIKKQTAQKEEEKTTKIDSLATTIMIRDGLSYIDALEKAREEVEKE